MSLGSPPLALREIGHYEIIDKIAEGGMGAVYKARHRSGGDIVAIKVIPQETARNPLLLKRFEQEFRAASLIDHPNVVKAIEYCGSVATPFLVMEYVDGESLGERVDRTGPLSEKLALHLIAQVCEGLRRAHKQGLIHRDVKPDNILVTHDNIAKITDLGLVKDVEAELNLTKTGKGLGTTYYMSPEQFRNAKDADVRCDVYSLGATLYMLVTGQVPFDKTSPMDCWLKKTKNELPAPKLLAPLLSDRVDFAIRRSMAPNAADRPASCREFMEDLTGLPWKAGQLAGTSVDSLPPPTDASTIWYMVYYDADSKARTVKGTTETIRANAIAGTLGDLNCALVSRSKSGPFAPFKKVAEFRDLVLSPSGPWRGQPGPRLTNTQFSPPHSNLNGDAAGNEVHAQTPTPRDARALLSGTALPEKMQSLGRSAGAITDAALPRQATHADAASARSTLAANVPPRSSRSTPRSEIPSSYNVPRTRRGDYVATDMSGLEESSLAMWNGTQLEAAAEPGIKSESRLPVWAPWLGLSIAVLALVGGVVAFIM